MDVSKGWDGLLACILNCLPRVFHVLQFEAGILGGVKFCGP